MTDKLFNALSLCQKAGGLTVGFDAVCESVLKGEASLVMFAEDLSPKTRKRVVQVAEDIEMIDLPYTQLDLAVITRKTAGVLAVTNHDLAVLCRGALPDKEETV